MTTKTPAPSKLTDMMVNMGYNAEISAPLIVNTYLDHKHNGTPLPKNWEASTIKDIQTVYNKAIQEVN